MADFTANFTLEEIEAIESTFTLNDGTELEAVFVIHADPNNLVFLDENQQITSYKSFPEVSTNFYVNSETGVDEGFGLTEETAFKTIQYALDLITSIPNINNAVINCTGITFQENIIIPQYGSGNITIIGTGATKTDTVLKAATTAGTFLTHKNNNFVLTFDNLTIQDCNYIFDVDNADFAINDVTCNFVSRGGFLTNGASLSTNSGTPTWDGGTTGSTAISLSAGSKFLGRVPNTFVGVQGAIGSNGTDDYVYLNGINATLRTGGLLGVYSRSGNLRIVNTNPINIGFETKTTNCIGIQVTDGLATITAGTTFNITNAYYGFNFNGYSHWNEGSTCTFNYTNCTYKAYCEYGAEITSNNYLGTGSANDINWFSSFSGSNPSIYGSEIQFLKQSVNNTSSNTTLSNTYATENVDASGGAKTKTLPSSVLFKNKIFIIRKKDSSANTVTIVRYSGDTINGSASDLVLTAQNECVMLQSDCLGDWMILSHYTS